MIATARAATALGNTTGFASPEVGDFRLMRWKLLAQAKKLLPEERITACMTRRQAGQGGFSGPVEVYRHQEGKNSFYGKLCSCGSIWACPICANKISESRVKEVCDAMDKHILSGGTCLMLTYTFRHHLGEALEPMVRSFMAAVRGYKSGKGYQNAKKTMGYMGSIKSTEITYGENGFHPHCHEVIFTKYLDDDSIREVEVMLFARWEKYVMRHGLGVINTHGLRLQRTSTTEYVAKHGTSGEFRNNGDRELVRGYDKKARGGRNMWDLLRESIFGGARGKFFGELFRQYYYAFKGKKQLVWSRGLKDKFGIRDVTDEQLLKGVPEGYEKVGELSVTSWNFLYRMNLQGEFLNAVSDFGFSEALKNFNLSESTEKYAVLKSF